MAFRLAEDVQEVADRLIDKHHGRLQGVTVTAVFVDKVPTSKGRQVWARAKKVSGLPAFLVFAESVRGLRGLTEAHEYGDQPNDFFVIEVAEEVWSKLADPARKALVDEALSSCEIEEDEETGSVKLAVVGPDVSGWRDVVKRHGLWREDLEEFVRAGAEQLSLEEVEELVERVTDEGDGEGDNLEMSITHNGRTVHTNTDTLNRMAADQMAVGGGRSS